MGETTQVQVLTAFADDNGKVVYPGALVAISNARVEQAVRDGWCCIPGERVSPATLRKNRITQEPEPDAE